MFRPALPLNGQFGGDRFEQFCLCFLLPDDPCLEGIAEFHECTGLRELMFIQHTSGFTQSFSSHFSLFPGIQLEMRAQLSNWDANNPALFPITDLGGDPPRGAIPDGDVQVKIDALSIPM